MSLWEAYRNLSPRTRIYLGVGVITWSAVGLYFTEKWEKRLETRQLERNPASGQPSTPNGGTKANDA